ncbi:hypothetical protein [Phaeobacter sp. HF9A]|uniref:hypothetical protein n=1 Tax=Phaeobacter sp. HF9A TaxID=2721561 RepID=UPI00142F8B2F|nr:hypothetical protein [Phaeobacter sp. HF9A]NIZ13704.1 hypothetical protein [Phaeobacter sp. HF9A]
MDLASEIYPGGYYELMRRLEQRQAPFRAPLAVLPEADADLAPYFERLTDGSAALPEGDRCDAPKKMQSLRQQLHGAPEVLALHAMVIAILRRREPPPEAVALFMRLWRDHGARLAALLSARWMIAAATTFADHGETMDQRLGGQGLSLLFDLIKLHESERRLSGRPASKPFRRRTPAEIEEPLAFDLSPYSLRTGDLDKNMLARLWRHAEADAVLRPLGFAMLRMVMSDERTVFARIQKFKKRDRWFED